MKRLALLVLAACGGAPSTAVRVRVELEQSVRVTQLRFSGLAGRDTVFGPDVRPDSEGGSLESGGDLLVLLPDRLASRDLACRVDGLLDGRVVASGQGMVRIELGREVECVAQLGAPATAEEPRRWTWPGPTVVPPCAGCLDAMGSCK